MDIIAQLKDKCDCIDVADADVDELINLISNYTCWAQNPCETFVSEERKEVVDLPLCVQDCDVFIFTPFYRPFESESFTFTLIEQDGINETATPVADYVYSAVDENFRISLPLPNCNCAPKCGCEKTYKLLVTYVAGYETVPDCLVPLFCEALQWIRVKNECDCSECEPCNQNQRDTGVIDYTTLTGRLQDFFLDTLTKQYIRQLGLISLCEERSHIDMWAVVV